MGTVLPGFVKEGKSAADVVTTEMVAAFLLIAQKIQNMVVDWAAVEQLITAGAAGATELKNAASIYFSSAYGTSNAAANAALTRMCVPGLSASLFEARLTHSHPQLQAPSDLRVRMFRRLVGETRMLEADRRVGRQYVLRVEADGPLLRLRLYQKVHRQLPCPPTALENAPYEQGI